jgi:hypothetical protein
MQETNCKRASPSWTRRSRFLSFTYIDIPASLQPLHPILSAYCLSKLVFTAPLLVFPLRPVHPSGAPALYMLLPS